MVTTPHSPTAQQAQPGLQSMVQLTHPPGVWAASTSRVVPLMTFLIVAPLLLAHLCLLVYVPFALPRS
jgi:hypothetical protein